MAEKYKQDKDKGRAGKTDGLTITIEKNILGKKLKRLKVEQQQGLLQKILTKEVIQRTCTHQDRKWVGYYSDGSRIDEKKYKYLVENKSKATKTSITAYFDLPEKDGWAEGGIASVDRIESLEIRVEDVINYIPRLF